MPNTAKVIYAWDKKILEFRKKTKNTRLEVLLPGSTH